MWASVNKILDIEALWRKEIAICVFIAVLIIALLSYYSGEFQMQTLVLYLLWFATFPILLAVVKSSLPIKDSCNYRNCNSKSSNEYVNQALVWCIAVSSWTLSLLYAVLSDFTIMLVKIFHWNGICSWLQGIEKRINLPFSTWLKH